jgi:DNA repair protein RecO (recombination protein O)
MEGIIYKVQPYKEHARLLFVYTKEGKKTLIAQGSQKTNNPTRVLAQYLTHIAFKENNKSMFTLSEAKLINDFQSIKESYDKTKQAALILEIVDRVLIEDVTHDWVYKEVLDALHAKDIQSSALSFSFKILKPLGYELQFIADGRPLKGVSIAEGGIIYQTENKHVDLDLKDAVICLKLSKMPYDDCPNLNDDQMVTMKNFVLEYYRYHLQTTLKTLQ